MKLGISIGFLTFNGHYLLWLKLWYDVVVGPTGDLTERGWTGAFYPGTITKKLPYHSKFFDTAEMDSTF
jgi:hypothetical protein